MKFFRQIALFAVLAVAAVPAQAAQFKQYLYTVSTDGPLSVVKPCAQAGTARSAKGWLNLMIEAGYQRCEMLTNDQPITLRCMEEETVHAMYIYESLKQCKADRSLSLALYRVLNGQ
jgi:hypothetical protein